LWHKTDSSINTLVGMTAYLIVNGCGEETGASLSLINSAPGHFDQNTQRSEVLPGEIWLNPVLLTRWFSVDSAGTLT